MDTKRKIVQPRVASCAYCTIRHSDNKECESCGFIYCDEHIARTAHMCAGD